MFVYDGTDMGRHVGGECMDWNLELENIMKRQCKLVWELVYHHRGE